MKAVAGNLADEMAVKAANGRDFDLKEVFGKFRQVHIYKRYRLARLDQPESGTIE
jgi:hypothetical protein